MGQHKNNAQIEIFIKFMEQHIDLARGFVKGDRVHFEQLWTELANELNASGPPTKTVMAWKKVWTDMKLCVKHRLSHNKVEISKTGGGRFNKYILSPSDEQVALICGLYTSVDGIENVKTFGVPETKIYPYTNDNVPTTSTVCEKTSTSKSPSNEEFVAELSSEVVADRETLTSTPLTPTTPCHQRYRKRKQQVAEVKGVIAMKAEHFSKISANSQKIKKEVRENGRHLKELSRNFKEIKLLEEKELKEVTRHHYVLEQRLKVKNEIKLKFLELEQMKLGLQSSPINT